MAHPAPFQTEVLRQTVAGNPATLCGCDGHHGRPTPETAMNMLVENFRHRHAAHCESGVASSMLSHHGAKISEAMAFGLSAAMAFAYLPFVKFAGFPLIAFRMPPKAILKGMVKPFKMRFHFETFRDPQKGMRRLDELLAEG